MTNTKNTKRALLSSVLALFLCFAMLLGTTYAWFTDSVTSAGNIIQSGTLDIEMYYADGTKAVPADDSADWKNADGVAIYTADQLWEPGYTDAKHIKISNEGTLALKYQLAIVPTGEVSELAEVIDVYLYEIADTDENATQVENRDDLNEAMWVGTLADVISKGIVQGNLAAETDYTTTIVLKMQETAGNEYQDLTIGDDFTIQLLATQYTAESDSFDNQYDEDAWMNGMWVYSAAQLNAAIAEVEDGGTIILAEDVTFDEDSCANSGGSWYEGLYYVGDKSFTLNLNGNKVTNDPAVNDYLMLFKNDGSKENVINIVNGTLEASSTAFCAICTSTASTQKITINLENVTLVGNNTNGSVAKIRGGAELNVKAGTVITGNDSYLGIESFNGIVNIYDGAEIYQKGSSSYNGSLVGVGGNGTVNVYGGYGEGASGGFIAMTSGGTINVYGGEWIANTDGTVAGDNNAVLIAQSDKATYGGGNSVINVLGGVFAGGFNCYGNAVGDAQINISAGTFNTDPSAYLADGFKALESNGTYYVVSDEIDAVVTTSADLAAAIAQGGTVYVAADIDVNNAWTSVKPTSELIVLGNGKSITNLNLPLLAGGVSTKATFKGLTIADSNVAPAAYENGLGSGAFIPYVDASGDVAFEDCHLVNTTVTGNERAGGFVGYTSGQTLSLKGCTVDKCEITAVGGAAGLVAYSQTVTTIEDCSVTNTKVAATEDRLGTKAALAGSVIGTVNANIAISNLTASGNTVSNNNALPAFSNEIGRIASSGNLTIDGAIQKAASDQNALNSAVASGSKVEVSLSSGNYTMPESALQGKTITISGTKDTVIDMTAVDARDQFVTGANIVFDGVTLNFGTVNYMGLANTTSLTYRNCQINGLQFLYGENVTFENCVLNSNGAEHCVWTYGAKTVNFIGCDFTYGDRGINCYSDNDVVGGKQTVNFTDCTFTTTNTASEGAVEINSVYFSVGIEVNMEGCTAPAYGEMAYVSPWDSNNGAKTTINIK